VFNLTDDHELELEEIIALVTMKKIGAKNIIILQKSQSPGFSKGIRARAGTKSIVIPHTILPVFGISISFKPWGFHEPK